MKNIREMIAVMQHFADGGKVEFREKITPGPWDSVLNPSWDWSRFDYRIAKPEPKSAKMLAFIDDQGTLRWIREELFRGVWKRVPSEDKIIDVEND